MASQIKRSHPEIWKTEFMHRSSPSNQSLEDRAEAMFCCLTREIKFGLFSRKRDSPAVRIETCMNMDICQVYLSDIGVVRKSGERNVNYLNNNRQLCNILGSKWHKRMLNINGDFCYVVAGTVQCWLHEENPVKEFVYNL